MRPRNRALVAALALIALPAILAVTGAASFRLRNRNNGAIVSSGEKREYLLYVPRSYRRSELVPLVISLHGAGGWPAQQMELSGWNRLADREGFLVVYPAAIETFGPAIWNTGDGTTRARDVRFISDLIDKLQRDYRIDPRRIYVNGFSNGGGMSFVLSCTMSDRIAAAGIVSSAQLLSWSWCTDRHPIPMIAFHGTGDRMAPYGGGDSWLAPEPFLPLPNFVAAWARRNGCSGEVTSSTPGAGVIRREYLRCSDDAQVVFYTLDDGHVWPGGAPLPEWFVGRDSRSLDATAEMWRFFKAHPLSRRAGRATPSFAASTDRAMPAPSPE